jgi:hypothetical protein
MFVFALAVMAMASESAVAQVTYVYTGNAFNIFSCDESGGGCNVAAPDNPYTSYLAGDHVVATLILDSELGANFDGDASLLPGFSLTLADGQQILTDEGSAYFGAYLVTDGDGNITSWNLFIASGNASDSSILTYGTDFFDYDAGILASDSFGADSAGIMFTRGTWALVDDEPSAEDLTEELITTVQGMQIPQLGGSLTNQLQTVMNDIATGNGLACQDLKAFSNHVKAQTGKKIKSAQASEIQNAVAEIKASLGCE